MNEYKDLKLTVASSPHVNSPVNTRQLMLDLLLALIPAMAMGTYFFSWRALAMTAVSVVGCEVFEWGYRAMMKKPQTGGDLTAAVTGVLLAFTCPVALPYWVLLIGDFFAIVIVKQLFGGLGKNFLNPALAGRAFLMLAYSKYMATWVSPGTHNWMSLTGKIADVVSQATPMADLHSGKLPWQGAAGSSLQDLFLGNVGGCIGEISAAALLLGGVYLILLVVIKPRITVAYLGTVAILTVIFPQGNNNVMWMLSQLCGGGLMLGAFFMATDYVTRPCTPKGEWIFGVGCGLLTDFIRYFGSYPEGVSYAILLMNVLTPIIEKYTHPGRFGVTGKKGGAKA